MIFFLCGLALYLVGFFLVLGFGSTTQTVRRAFRRLGMEHQTQILFLLFFLLMPIRASSKHLTAICIKRLLRRKRGVFFPSSPSIGKFMITAWSQNFARTKISSGPETREREKNIFYVLFSTEKPPVPITRVKERSTSTEQISAQILLLL